MKHLITMLLAAVLGSAQVHAYTYALQAQLKLDETSGTTAADASAESHDATLSGGAAFTTSGHTGGGVTLNGTDGKITFNDNSTWGYYDEITVCAWVNLTDGGVVLARGSYISPFALIVNNSGTVTWAVNTESDGDTRYTSTATVGWNQWHHLAATYCAVEGTSRAYLDGVQIAGGPLTSKMKSSSNSWVVGTRANGYWLGGTVDDIRVYTRPLSQAEIQDIVDGTETADDTDAPSVPQNLTATPESPRMITLAWDRCTDNVKVAGYKVYKDGAYLATTHEDLITYTVYWLEPETQYDFQVSAIDHGDNESAKSGTATGTTQQEDYPDYYVGGWNINNEMSKITTDCMNTLKTKKVIGITKSFGGSMTSGYSRLKSDGSPYHLEAGNVGSPSASDFDSYVIIKADTTRYPYTFRVDALGEYMHNWAAPVVDAGFVFWHNMTASIYDSKVNYPYVFSQTTKVLDSLQTEYPGVKFIYTCSGVVGENELGKEANTHSMRFGELLINKKRGLVPMYDMASLLSIEASGDTSKFTVPYASYNTALQRDIDDEWQDAKDRIIGKVSTETMQIPASGLHPDGAGERRMALGMTLILAKVFCPDCFPQTQDTVAKSWVTDSLAIRAILDANGLQSVSVDGVVEEKDANGRVSTLSLRDPQTFTLTVLPPDIGDLDSLKTLYVYSNELTSLPAAIGNLTSLERLNISENKLTSLPSSISKLTSLMQLTMNDNLFTTLPEELLSLTSLVDNIGIILDSNSICDTTSMSTALNAFLDQKAQDWKTKQSCGTSLRAVQFASAPQLPFTLEHTPAAITVRWEAGTGMQLGLYTVTGVQLGATPMVTGGRAAFDVRSLEAGLYLLRLEQEGRTFMVKLTVIK